MFWEETDGGMGCQALRWVPHASAGRTCLNLCQLPAVLLGVLLHVVGALERGSEAICSHVTFPTSKLFLQLLAQPAPGALARAAGCVVSFLSAVGLFSLLLQEGFCFMSFLPAACCVGQAACHVLESLLPTPLPCTAIASLSVILRTLIRCSGCRCSGPAPVSDCSVVCDKRVDTWTTASPSITLRPSLLCCLLS